MGIDWLDRLLGPNPRVAELAAERDLLAEERDTLSAEVTALAEQVDKLTEALVNQRRDLRAEVRKARESALEAYEPVQVGGCNKVRYLHQEDAVTHATQIAIRNREEVFNVYKCRICPTYMLNSQRPWHVGHARPDLKPKNSVWADASTVYHKCGCQFGIIDHGLDYACDAHRDAG